MKIFIRNLLIYAMIGLGFTALTVYIYDGNLHNFHIVIQGGLLFTGIAIVMERIMMYFYVKIRLHYIIRIILIVLLCLIFYTAGVWISRPYLLRKVFYLPIFFVSIFPMFIIFAVIFEVYFQKNMKVYNKRLTEIQKRTK